MPASLPLVINPGDVGHIGHHEVIHNLLDGLGDLAFQDTVDTFTQDVTTQANFNATGPARFKTQPWADVTHPDYGALGNGSHDDTSAVQSASDTCPVGGTVFFPQGRYITTVVITVSKSIAWLSTGYYSSYLLPIACAGIIVVPGQTFAMRQFGISLATRYSTAPNAFIGIDVRGDNVNRPLNCVFEDVYIDGFSIAVQTDYMWTSRFTNFRCNFGLVGILALGLSVNNVVDGCHINVVGGAGSKGILLNGDIPSEGWIITNNVIDAAEIAIHGRANANIYVLGNIIDHCEHYGVLIEDNAVNFGGCWTIADNYIAMHGGFGLAAIADRNTIANFQNVGNRIHHNNCLTYSGDTCAIGISLVGAVAVNSIVDSNTCSNFTTRDLLAQVGNGCQAHNNNCRSGLGANSISGFEVARGNDGYNPFGTTVVAVPLTTVAVPAVQYDRVFYVTANTTTTTLACSAGPTVVAAVGVVTTYRVPAGATLTPTYTNAPTWVVLGE